MTKSICPCCQQTIKAAPKLKTGQYSSVQLESGAYMWTSPTGRQFKCSFPVDKSIESAHRKAVKMQERYNTAERNAKLGFTFEDVSLSLMLGNGRDRVKIGPVVHYYNNQPVEAECVA